MKLSKLLVTDSIHFTTFKWIVLPLHRVFRLHIRSVWVIPLSVNTKTILDKSALVVVHTLFVCMCVCT